MAVFPTKGKSQTQAKPAPKRARTNVQKVHTGGLTWYNFSEYTHADARYLTRNFNFHPLDMEDVASSRQRPKVDEYDDYLFIIFHVPYYDRRNKQMVQEEVDVFVGQDFLITIHQGRLKPLENLLADVRRDKSAKDEYMGKGPGYLLYEIISRLFENSFPMLDKIAERINVVEREIMAGNSKAMTEEISHLKLEIINFRRIIRPQRLLVTSLEARKQRFIPNRLDVYFDDVQDAIGRTNDLLDTYKEVVESLEDTNETFIQHRTNNVVKVLTVISLATLPGASLSGLLAMNVRYPFPVDAVTFIVIVVVSVLTALSLFAYMYWKRWL